jgi:hypothetical protein
LSEYYDRQGKPIDYLQARAKWLEGERRVAKTTLPNGRYVSTVWLGMDHQFGEGPPLIFETMVFRSEDDSDDLDCDRYSTEAEALAGHEAMCRKWLVKSPPEE